MNPPDERLLESLHAYLDGTLPPDQAAQLDELLAAHPELADALVECADVEWLVEKWYARQRHEQQAGRFTSLLDLPFDFDAAVGPPSGPQLVESAAEPTPRPARWRQLARRCQARLPRMPGLHWRHTAVAAAALVALILVGSWFFPLRRPSAPAMALRIAQVTASVDALWSDASAPDEDGWLPGETVELRRGQVEVRFASGALVVLRAPARFQAAGPLEARLTRGALRARMERGATRFHVHTPTADVVDLSTEFGLAVTDSGTTDIAVFDGEVDVSTAASAAASAPAASATTPRRLGVGEGLRVDTQGLTQRLTMVTDEMFPATTAQRSAPRTAPPLIVSVSDNRNEEQSRGFYRVVSGGFGEDAPAYVDRVHEWNGLKPSGLPEFLVGADYIQPFCSDKSVKDLEITITLARPATVYVLIDDRGRTPEWLIRDFADTGVDVGLDEGPYGRGPAQPGRGAGVSIDTVFSVWRRDVRAPGSVVLGPRGDVVRFRGMYGIVVVPLEREVGAAAPNQR